MNDRDYDQAVRRIPHLNLTDFVPEIPHEAILQDFRNEETNVREFEYGIYTNDDPSKLAIVEYLKKHWQGFGIIDITERGDHMIDYLKEDVNHEDVKKYGIEFDENGFGIYKPTDIGKRLPNTLNYISKLFNKTGRVRFSILKAGGGIGWHNHEVKSLIDRKKLKKPLIAERVNRSAIHIPIIENPKSLHLVTKGWSKDYTVSDLFKPAEDAVIYRQHYSINQAWMFNTVHYHAAINHGDQDRVHLLCYFDHMDEGIRPFIEKAIDSYKGPLIESEYD